MSYSPFSRGDHVFHSPQGIMFSKLGSPNQVMGSGTHSVSALLLVQGWIKLYHMLLLYIACVFLVLCIVKRD